MDAFQNFTSGFEEKIADIARDIVSPATDCESQPECLDCERLRDRVEKMHNRIAELEKEISILRASSGAQQYGGALCCKCGRADNLVMRRGDAFGGMWCRGCIAKESWRRKREPIPNST